LGLPKTNDRVQAPQNRSLRPLNREITKREDLLREWRQGKRELLIEKFGRTNRHKSKHSEDDETYVSWAGDDEK